MTPLCRKAKNSIGLQAFKAKYGGPSILQLGKINLHVINRVGSKEDCGTRV